MGSLSCSTILVSADHEKIPLSRSEIPLMADLERTTDSKGMLIVLQQNRALDA